MSDSNKSNNDESRVTLRTAADIAAQLNVSAKTVRNWCNEKVLTPIRIGKRTVRYRPDEVDALLRK